MTTHRQVTIIGTGPAGLTAALYTGRANLHPLVIEGIEKGGQLMLTTAVDNYPGFRDGIMGPDLMEEMRLQAERFGATFVQGDVTKLDLSQRPFRIAVGKTEYTSDAVILATGASAKWLDLGVDKQLSGRGVSTCATCDGFFFKGRDVAIVGGGDTAMEEAIYLAKLASLGHGHSSPRHAARLEGDAGQGPLDAQHQVDLEHRGHRHQGRRQGRGDGAGAAQPRDA